jgi:hypothetical protein
MVFAALDPSRKGLQAASIQFEARRFQYGEGEVAMLAGEMPNCWLILGFCALHA